MGNIGSSNAKNKITDTDRAILALKTQRNRIEAQRKRASCRLRFFAGVAFSNSLSVVTSFQVYFIRQLQVIASIDRENAVARELVAAGKKDRAMLALKKRQLHEQQLKKLDAWVLNVESTLANVESAANLVSLQSALKQGNDALKEFQQQVTLEDVEQLMQDTAEAAEYQEKLKQMLGESWTGQDEGAVESALAALEDEIRLETRIELAEELPAVPTHKAQVFEKEEELPSVPSSIAVVKEEPQKAALLA